ncbi:histidinol-phosphatase [Actinomyces massiliensis]|jgi:histidinol-phosphate phosphatase hisN|uniref:Histidinol-phosphatase n=1 Tax=Actinomyces massiliensis F0489 TaxID=1125718 RepID=J1H433_9ACTO|nr:histidinol-phosphatase [Actinomyces massiliensis]EJF40275.1 histidinol-phosphatase [Actinomyces massiliensis F0489]WLD70964.1 histidinol-phosphatase [Actinomyces massiliensis]
MTESSPPSRTGERRWRDDLHLAHTIADQVDPLTQAHFDNQDFEIETKPDLTPVTVADREAERLIRDYLSRARTRDSVLGEEFGTTGHSPRQWIIDPIDGTKNFVRGVPVWASLISLAEDGEVVVGLVSAPALGKRWWAVKGGGAWSGRSLALARQLHVSSVADLEDASLSYSSLSGWVDRRRLRGMLSLMQGCWRTRAYGDFWSYMLLASGAVDVAAEPELEVYDMAALVPIVSEAGGRFTSLAGEPGPWGGDAVATNGPLHDAVLTLLAKETD